MNNNVNSFKKLLEDKMTKTNKSGDALGKILGIDGGYVRSWRRGERLPGKSFMKPESEPFKNLAKFLEKNHEELKIIIEEEIKNSNGKFKDGLGRPSSSSIDKAKCLEDPIDNPQKPTEPKKEVSKNRSYKTIRGSELLAEEMLSILERVEEVEKTELNGSKYVIYITFNGKESIFSSSDDLIYKWHKAIDYVTGKNWHIVHLIRLDNSIRSFELLARLFGRFKNVGYYHSYALNQQQSVLIPSYDIHLVSEREAILRLSSEKSSISDSGIYFNDKENLDLLLDHCLRLKENAKSIFNIFKSYEDPDLVQLLKNSDQQSGNRFNILRRLSEITRPLDWYQEKHSWSIALRKSYPNTNDFSRHLEARRARARELENFLRQEIGSCYYLYPKKVLDNFIKNGTSYPHYYIANIQERIEQLERFIYLLNNYPNFYISIASENVFNHIKSTFYEIKHNQFLFMEFYHEDSNFREYFTTSDKQIVKSFETAIFDIWKKLPQDEKNKTKIKRFLKGQIKLLKKSNN